MAFIFTKPNSKYWIAGFYDRDGKRRNRSTRVENKYANRRKAEKLAYEYEEASRNQQTAKQVRLVISQLHEEITGEELPVVTLQQHIDTWLKRKKHEVATSSYASYKTVTSKLSEFLKDRANKDINEVTRDNMTSFRNHLSEHLAAKTVNNRLKMLRMLFNDAVRDQYLIENPLTYVQPIKDNGSEEKSPFTIEELKKVLTHADNEWTSMIKFGLYTGQRIGDLAQLTWHNIDLSTETITLVTGKTDKRLIIPMAPPLKEHIESLPAGDNPDAPLHPDLHALWERANGASSTLSNQFGKLLEHAGLRPTSSHKSTGKGRSAKRVTHRLSFHSLRHTAVSMMHSAGIPAATVQALVGHDSDAVHKVYTHV